MVHHGPCAGSTGLAQGEGPRLELADIVRAHRAVFEQRHTLTPTQRAVLDAVERCRTAALGGHVDVCLECGFERPSYNSCHDRHCPKCPAVAQAKWIAGRLERVLPTHYFHLVFTLPSELRGIALRDPSRVYDLLFRSAAETLLTLGRDPERLGGELGVTLVLHTWSRDLRYHPHVHCIVTGGALSADGERWVSANQDYLFPVQVMRKLFRGKLLDALGRAQRRGELHPLDCPSFAATVARLHRKDWHVYAKRPFGGAEQVIRYLGQYTHRVAISNHRLIAMTDRDVTFHTKNGQVVTVTAETFLARWLTHLLPYGYVKIRHFGLMSSAHATTRLEQARPLIRSADLPQDAQVSSASALLPGDGLRAVKWRDVILVLTGVDLDTCPACGSRALQRRPLAALGATARAPPNAA